MTWAELVMRPKLGRAVAEALVLEGSSRSYSRPEGTFENNPRFNVGFAHIRIVEVPKGRLNHQKTTFQEEFVALLKKHNITYDARYLWE